jgi:phosphoribosyl-ATP pyrophosphohydrolase/phosphoribosyl-AMP cyclohydrolase
MSKLAFLDVLEGVIDSRLAEQPDDSYTAALAARGIHRIAQKVGEEGVEVALAAAMEKDELLISECADLLYHLTLLLRVRGHSLSDVADKLEQRHTSA